MADAPNNKLAAQGAVQRPFRFRGAHPEPGLQDPNTAWIQYCGGGGTYWIRGFLQKEKWVLLGFCAEDCQSIHRVGCMLMECLTG